MGTEKHASKRGYSGLSLVVAAACLWPAIAVAGPPNPTGSDANQNTAAGKDALLNVTGHYNTAIGFQALVKNTDGTANTACGNAALYFNTTGNENTACGNGALFSNTTASGNTASGANALGENTTGTRNTADGAYALLHNTSGNYNTATGEAALYSNTTGSANAAAGAEALYASTTGIRQTAMGYQALLAIKAGSTNVAVGYRALSALTAGSGNIALGGSAGYLTKSGNNNIYVGSNGLSGSESNVTRIGRTQTKVFVTGIAGVPLSGATVVIKSNGQLGVVASSARYKQNIKPLDDVSERLAQLRPVSFSYKAEPGATHYGLIAEEVDQVMPELVVRDEQNRPESVQYLELIPLLLEERQEMQAELMHQRVLIEQQAETLAALQRALDTRLAALEAIGRVSSASND